MNSLIWRKHLFRLATILKEQSQAKSKENNIVMLILKVNTSLTEGWIIKQINAVLSSDFALGLFLPASFVIVGKVIFMSHNTILFKRFP